jgi:quercetin dioxygenase-like cupin family protein
VSQQELSTMDARARYIGPGEGGRSRVFASELEVKAGRHDGLSFGMFRSTFPPGGGMPFLHLHRTYEEAFYLIQGEVEFHLGDEEVRAVPGSAVLIPPGAPHCFRNVGEGEADWIVITTPPVAVQLIEEVGSVAPGDLDALAQLFDRYDSELLERRPHWTQ